MSLFDFAEHQRRDRLAGSPLGMLRADEIVVDLFCGGGGATQGVEQSGGGMTVHECVNHCATAIETHEANHPDTNHRRGDVWKNTPAMVAAGRPVGLLWASPDCRHFSRARGAAPVSRRVRDLAWVVTRWAVDAAPRVIIVENVAEFREWGPTRARRDEHGREVKDGQGRPLIEPVPERKGQTFRKWVRKLEKCGYVVEHRVLDAADYGAASRRKRLFVIARRDGAPIVWPERTHGRADESGESSSVSSRVGGRVDAGRAGGQGAGGKSDRAVHGDEVCAAAFAAPGRSRHRAAAEIIDWSDLGTSIFDRKRPLADKTLARIAEGIRRYVIEHAAPFVLRVTQTGSAPGKNRGWQVSGIDRPMPTQTTRQDLAVCTPIIQANRGNATPRDASEPLPTITAGNGPGRGAGAGHALSVCTPVMATVGYGERDGQSPRCRSVADLLGTCVNSVKDGLVAPVLMHNTSHHTGGPVTSPVPTVTTGGQTGLVAPVLGVLRNNGDAAGVDGPLPTITSGGTHTGLITPLVMSAGGPECVAVPADQPLGTVLPRDHRALVAALLVKFYGAEKGGADARAALGTVTTRDRHGLVCVVISGVEYVIVDILFRMLKPRELAAAMGFPASYVWPKTQREAVRLIGNAVSPPMAEALVRAVLPRGREIRGRGRGEKKRRAVG